MAPATSAIRADAGGRVALAGAGDQRDRAGDVLGAAVDDEPQVRMVGHLTAIGARRAAT